MEWSNQQYKSWDGPFPKRNPREQGCIEDDQILDPRSRYALCTIPAQFTVCCKIIFVEAQLVNTPSSSDIFQTHCQNFYLTAGVRFIFLFGIRFPANSKEKRVVIWSINDFFDRISINI